MVRFWRDYDGGSIGWVIGVDVYERERERVRLI